MIKTAEFSKLKVGERGRVVSLHGCDRAYRHKLLMMGLTRGTEFTVLRMAPLGDPVEILVRGFSLSLRRGELQGLCIEPLGQ